MGSWSPLFLYGSLASFSSMRRPPKGPGRCLAPAHPLASPGTWPVGLQDWSFMSKSLCGCPSLNPAQMPSLREPGE